MDLFKRASALAGFIFLSGCAMTPIPTDYYSSTVKELAPKRGVLVVSA